MANHPNKLVGWIEVNTPNVPSALSFYGNVFGFTNSAMDMGEMGTYHMLHHGDSAFGGLMDISGPEWEGVPPHLMVYFTTGDIDVTMEAVKAAGGQVKHGPMDIPGGGQIAVCVDDQGAFFSLVDEKGTGSEEYSKAVTWVENMSPDRAKTIAFYTKALGWNHTEEDMGEIGMYSMFGRGEGMAAGAMQNNEEGMPACWTVYFYTENADSTMGKMKDNGGQVMFGPEDIPEVGRIVMGTDCCGAMIAIHQPAQM